ncbi:mitotic-spindle organizing protein 2 isoform X1 [Pseudoliparis swirei]|uniref:mitotic-spindle organizing protein 2 isoform X1 n=2 Tax=Pseudoliparis swirei TaxID=2059687 RepID=UPI0024BE536A|nr:mitotic-spindle organizing protein 2 isoform X1 [Pseudoliparis swirei]
MSQQPQQTLPSAPGSPALVVTSNVQKYAIKKKKVLSAEEAELFELTQAAGVTVDQEVFKIIVDLLKMNVAPQAVFQTLKAMCAGQRVAEVGESSTVSHAASAVSITTTAPTEAKVRGKTGASHGEKSREASGQRVQRQPSATRGQKTKSSGSSSSSSQINSTSRRRSLADDVVRFKRSEESAVGDVAEQQTVN